MEQTKPATKTTDNAIFLFPKSVQRVHYFLKNKDTNPDMSFSDYENGSLNPHSAMTTVALAAATLYTNKDNSEFPTQEALQAFKNYGRLVLDHTTDQDVSNDISRLIKKTTKRWEHN